MADIPLISNHQTNFANGKLKVDNAHSTKIKTTEDGKLEVSTEVAQGRFQVDHFSGVTELEINGSSGKDTIMVLNLPSSVKKLDIATMQESDCVYVNGGPEGTVINTGGQTGKQPNQIVIQNNKSTTIENVASGKIPRLKFVEVDEEGKAKKDEDGKMILKESKSYYRGKGDYIFKTIDGEVQGFFKATPKARPGGILS